MKNGITAEICAGSLNDVLTASRVEYTDRIELNCALELGGLSPSLAVLKAAKKVTEIPLIVMCRPRPAGFVYTRSEKELMYEDAKLFLENGADGIVFGSLNADHDVDEPFVSAMCELIHSYEKTAVFHKAFDDAKDPFAASEALIACHIDRILTSGKAPDALSGAKLIHALNERYGSRIEYLPGGGVSETNVRDILALSDCRQIHMSAKTSVDQDGTYFAVNEERIRNILNQLD